MGFVQEFAKGREVAHEQGLFGGIDPQTGGTDQTWVYDGVNWSALDQAAAMRRERHGEIDQASAEAMRERFAAIDAEMAERRARHAAQGIEIAAQALEAFATHARTFSSEMSTP